MGDHPQDAVRFTADGWALAFTAPPGEHGTAPGEPDRLPGADRRFPERLAALLSARPEELRPHWEGWLHGSRLLEVRDPQGCALRVADSELLFREGPRYALHLAGDGGMGAATPSRRMALRALTGGTVASTEDAAPGDRLLRLVLDAAGIGPDEETADPAAGSGRLPGIDEAFHVAHRSNSPYLPQPALELDHDPDTRAALGVGPLSSRDVLLPDGAEVRPVIAGHWAARRSKRSFRSRERIHLARLAAFLEHSARLRRSGDGLLRGTVPSGGNRQPLDFYVVAHDVEELPRGVYYYRRVSHRLCPVASDAALVDAFVDDARAALASDGSPAALVVVTGRFDRTGRKYQTPGLPYSLILKEVGAFFQMAGMVAAELGLGFTPLGAGSDRFFTEAVGGTSSTQGVVGECVLGLKDR